MGNFYYLNKNKKYLTDYVIIAENIYICCS